MQIQIIYPDIFWPGYPGDYYNGVGSLAASLKKNRHSVSLVHITKRLKEKQLISLIDSKTDLIAVSATSLQHKLASRYAGWIKKRYDIPIICGGIHATLFPEEVLSDSAFDMACVGEGEFPLIELAGGKDRKNIKNIYFKTNGNVIKNDLRPLISNLDELPFPDRAIFDFKNLIYSRQNSATFMASRGCPYKCSYCCNHALSNVLGNNYVRFRSPEAVIEEIEKVLNDYPFITSINMDDDILPLKIDWFEKFADLYSKKIGVPWSCNIRANLVSSKVVDLLKSSNCCEVRMGLESGDVYIRNKVLKRNMPQSNIIHAASMIKEAGMSLSTFNIVGNPSEDVEAMLKTVKLNAEIRPDNIQTSICYAFPGTVLYDDVNSNRNIINDDNVISYFNGSNINHDKLSAYQIYSFKVLFKYIVRAYQSERREELIDRILKNKVAAIGLFGIAKLAQKYLDTKRFIKFLK